MNEKDLEERLRSVVDGPRPSAPLSLRNFLRELPESQSRRPWPLAWLATAAGSLRRLASPAPAMRHAKFAFAVSVAVVFGLIGGGLLMSARQHTPAATPPTASETASPPPTPRRSIATAWPPNVFTLKNITGFQWAGILSTNDGNDKQAMPVSAVALQSGGYIGVSTDEFGKNGLVFSADGIYWNWDPPTDVDPSGVTLTSIATNGKGQLVIAGAAVGRNGTKDGRIYTSTDGHQWTAIANAVTLFGGTGVRTVVYGPSGYVALGWNDGDPASRTVREWLSTDGVHWSLMSGVPIVGTAAFILPVQYGYFMSGSPQASKADPPIWFSSDGHTWLRAVWKNQVPIAVGPILSATSTYSGIVAIVQTADGSGTQLLRGTADGINWHAIGSTNAPDLMSIASIEGPIGRLLVATGTSQDGHVYVSTDDAVTPTDSATPTDTVNWSLATDLSTLAGAPLGQTLLQLGVNDSSGSAKVLCFGHPDYKMGVWLGYSTGQ
jgi:hypothetical protein